MYCRTAVSFYKDGFDAGIGFGKGIAMLLERVDKFGSINQATRDMGMAYSKAWRILKATEAEFGVSLVSRDGARGSSLTEDARRLIELYYALNECAREAVLTEIEARGL
ncbi:MAG: LysR family transcriptional regulator [Oscillospiraceae bacterium]|nr:LysR family transcriptional regulator [Oscillospiraceae bacterium]